MNKRILFLFVVVLSCFIAFNEAFAVEKHWVGTGRGTGALWNVATNWNPTGVHESTDDVLIDGGGNLTINTNAYCFSFTQYLSPGTQDFMNNATLTVGDGGLTIIGGQLKMNASNNTITVTGDWYQEGGSFIAGAGSIVLNGTARQIVTTFSPFWNLTIDNSEGVELNSDLEIGGDLALVNGLLITDPYSLVISPTGSVARTNGYVSGNMTKYVPEGSTVITYEIGDELNYSPVTVTFGDVSTAGNLMVEAFAGDHPLLPYSPIDENQSVNRFWIFSNSGTEFDYYDAVFNFIGSDLDPTANTDNFIIGKIDISDWELPTVGTKTATSTEALGMSTMSDFAIGEIKTFDILASSFDMGTLTPSGTVIVDYGSNQVFDISPDPGYHLDSLFVDGMHVDSITSYTFYDVTAGHSIHAKFIADTLEIVASAGANGTISPLGDVHLVPHTNQTFTIAPNGGYHILDVIVDGESVGPVSEYTFENVITDHTISTSFSIDQYSLYATSIGGGTISPSGSIIVDSGATKTFTLIPDVGNHVDSLFVDGVHVDSTSSYTFYDVKENHTIHAKFTINTYTVTATTGPNGSIDPSGVINLNYGQDQQFCVTPDYGYHVDSLFVDGIHVDSIACYTFYDISANHTIFAKFAVNVYTIGAGATSGGTITPAGLIYVNHGGDQAFTITPNIGYHLDELFVDGVHVDSTTSYTFENVSSDHTIFANFAIDQFEILATSTVGGTLNPSGAVIVNYGADQQFTIVSDIGYYFDSLFVDGVHVDSSVSYTFYNVMANHSIDAKFKIFTYTITSSAGANGTIDPLGAVVATYGSSRTFTITPNFGYHVDSLYIDGVSVSPITSYTFDGIITNHTIHATFTLNVYTILSTATSGGTITPSGSINVNHGSSQQFLIAVNIGYHLDTLFVDGVHVDSTTSYTFNNVVANHSIHAKFAIDTYIINAMAGANGSISPAGEVVVNYGSDQLFNFNPNTGYYVDSVFVDGAYIGAVPNYTFYNVTAPHTIRVTFKIYAFTINATAGAGGSITPSGIVGANYGTSQQFTIAPNVGYHVDSVFVDGAYVDSTTSYTFYNITTNHTINVTFRANVYTITATSEGLGIIIPSGFISVNHGTNQQFFMVATYYGFEVVALLVDDVIVDSTLSYTFYNVTGNHTIHAVFGQRVRPLPTLTNIHPTGAYRGDSLASVYCGSGIAINYIQFFPGSSESLKASIKINYNAIVGSRDFYVSNAPPGGGPSEIMKFSVLNHAPTAAMLTTPADLDTLEVDELENVPFGWEGSSDLDIIDTVKYTFRIWGPLFDTTVTGLSAASIEMNLTSKLSQQENYYWTVFSTDGYDIVASPDTFLFHVRLWEDVKDIAGLPTEFALRQNYPNPFNPSTRIQFALPKQSVVTLKVYDVIGTEVATLIEHQSLTAGMKEVTFDAANLASGIYFYRLFAVSDDGITFIRSHRMILMK
ncbi:MAG: T9SS type A sorting domain-containing protein [Ignavibacteriales bacterium]|nr:T9SS type A sorting domain-containing protein [Ignavibacteriales bacterium]